MLSAIGVSTWRRLKVVRIIERQISCGHLFVTVQKLQDNGEWKDADPGHVGSTKDKCTCLFCGKWAVGVCCHNIHADTSHMRSSAVRGMSA